MRYKGLGFPYIFNSKTKSSVKATDLDKIKSDINLIIRQELRTLYMRPDVGTDWDSVFYMDDIQVTRDMIYTFINEAIVKEFQGDVVLDSVETLVNNGTAIINLGFKYKVADTGFAINFPVGGTYE